MAEDNNIKLKWNTKYDGTGAEKAASAIKRHWADIKAKFDLTVSAIKTGWNAFTAVLEAPFKFETQTVQFKTLIGDIDKAKAHMADLKALGDTPPFSLDEFAAASRSLMALTDGTLGYKHSLELIGDAAAATGVPLESLSSSIGYLYACIRDGEPIERATKQLSRMGVITPETAAELGKLQKAGASNVEIWQKVEQALGKYSGAMKETETTGAGLIAAIQTRWDNIVRKFGDAFASTAKDGLAKFLDHVKNLEENGTLEKWAEKVKAAIGWVVEAASKAVAIAGKLADAYSWVQDSLEKVGSAAGAAAGTLWAGGSFDDAKGAAQSAWNDTAREQADRAKDAAEVAAKAAEATAERVKEAAKETAQAVATETQRITDDLKQHAEKRAEILGEAEDRELQQVIDANKAAFEEMQEAKKQALDAELELTKENNKKELKELDDKISEAKKKMREWENEAKLARGVNADDWRHAEQVRQNRADKQQARMEKEARRLQDENDRINAKNPKLLNDFDRRRLAENQKWLDANGFGNGNPFQQQIDQLQAARDKIAEETRDEIKRIKDKMDALGLK